MDISCNGAKMYLVVFFFQAEDGIRDFCLSRGLGDVYKRQPRGCGRLSGVRETQQFLRGNQGNRVDYTDLIKCGHKL